jgi:hypothetical protein
LTIRRSADAGSIRRLFCDDHDEYLDSGVAAFGNGRFDLRLPIPVRQQLAGLRQATHDRSAMSSEPYHPQPWEASLEAAVRPKQKISRLQLAVYLTYKGDVDVYQIRKSPHPACLP